MDWLYSVDLAAFRLINITLSNPLFDRVMPFFSDNKLFIPAVVILAIALLWKGSARGRIFVLMLLVVISIGDGWICNTLKDTLERPRPFNSVLDAHVLIGKGGVYGNVIRTGLMLNAGKDQVDQMVDAIDAGLALASAR